MRKNYCRDVVTFQDSATVLGNGRVLLIQEGYNLLTFEVTGEGESSVVLEAQFIENGGWHTIPVYSLPDLTMSTTIAEKGKVYQTDLHGVLNVRCRVSDYVGGSVTVKGRIVS